MILRPVDLFITLQVFVFKIKIALVFSSQRRRQRPERAMVLRRIARPHPPRRFAESPAEKLLLESGPKGKIPLDRLHLFAYDPSLGFGCNFVGLSYFLTGMTVW
jgi:hypothetical protein